MTTADPTWTDAAGRIHDLTQEKRITTGIAGRRLNLTARTVCKLVQRGELRPVFRRHAKHLEIYECVLADFIARNLKP
jgi:hypothetical protein